MDDAKALEIRQWLTKAVHDLRSARRLFSDEPPLLDTAVYHCQQSAEKSLKAYLTLQDISFLKTHLLTVLVEQCILQDDDFENLRNAAEILTPYATAFRYPGDSLEPIAADVEEAIQLADEVYSFVLNKMSHEFRSD